MAKLLKLRGGTTSQHSSFTGAEREVTVDTDKETLVVHDGSTAGGFPLTRITWETKTSAFNVSSCAITILSSGIGWPKDIVAVFTHPLQESHLGGLLVDLNSS